MGKHNQINKKLRNDDSQLPSEYSWDNMKAGIESQMETIETTSPAEAQPKQYRKLGFLLLLFGVISLVGGYVYLNTQDESSQLSLTSEAQSHTTSKSEHSTEQTLTKLEALPTKQITDQSNTKNSTTTIKQKQSSSQTNTATQNRHNSNEAINANDVKQTPALSTVQTVVKTLPQTTSRMESVVSKETTQTQSNSASVTQSQPTTTHSVTSPSASPGQVTDRSSDQAPVLIESEKQVIKEQDSETEPSLTNSAPESNLISNDENHNIDPEAETISIEPKESVTQITPSDSLVSNPELDQKTAIRLILSAGSNLYNQNFRGSDLANARTAANSLIIGQSAQLRVEFPLKNNWSITTGIGYDRSVTRLDYTGTIDTLINADVTIHDKNNASGIVNTHQQTHEVSGTFLTEVELYNKHRSINIPLLLQKSFSLGSLMLNIGAGMEYRYLTMQNGRYLVEPNLIGGDYQLADYGNADPFKTHLLNALTSVSLDYQFAHGYGLGLGVDGAYSLTDASAESTTQSNPMLLRGTMRLTKQF